MSSLEILVPMVEPSQVSIPELTTPSTVETGVVLSSLSLAFQQGAPESPTQLSIWYVEKYI